MKKFLFLSFDQSIGGSVTYFGKHYAYSRIFLATSKRWKWTPFIWVSKEYIKHGISYNINIFRYFNYMKNPIKQLWKWLGIEKLVKITLKDMIIAVLVVSFSMVLLFKQGKLSRLANRIKVKEMEIEAKDICIKMLSKNMNAIQSEYETGDFIYR
jgi:FlaA1/EpsC-like NDP-sugar epimerase